MSEEIQTIKQRFHIIGNNPQLNRAIEVAIQVARTDLSILVTGESGVGKEFFPQIIHATSSRKHGPYFAVNCGAIPEGTIDSELFGHEKGAFTDAKAERKGYFEIADGGTLFLDEVGELPQQTQARLLRVLESGEFIRVGSSIVQKTNVRVVAATNMDMIRAIENGRFREDLYYRLNSVEIKVPSLRERKEDIPLLFRKFACDFGEKYHMPPIRLNDEAVELLKSYYWQGNIRQLKNMAEKISAIEINHDITADILRKYLPEHELQKALVVGKGQRHISDENFMDEREILYKVLFDMKREISELREQFRQISQATVPEVNPTTSSINEMRPTQSIKEMPSATDFNDYQMAEEVKEEIKEDNREDVATVRDAEREIMRQALEKHHGCKAAAARSIQMPDRSFYRKCKLYGL